MPEPYQKLLRRALGLLVLGGLLYLPGATMAASPALLIEGGDSTMQENIRAWLAVTREPRDLPTWRERAIRRDAHRDAEKAMQALGHYQSELKIDIQRNGDCWQMHLTLQPGKPVRVAELTFNISGEAQSDPAFTRLRSNAPLKKGDIARHDRYEQLKNRLVRLGTERGYFAGILTEQQFVIDPDAGEARVTIGYDSGARYDFGDISFEQDILQEQLIQRFVTFRTGDPFDNSELLALRQSLSSSGYFNEIRIQTEPNENTRTVPVTVTATPRPRHSWLAGIGFATDTGPRLRLGYENRRANRLGHRYGTELEASPVQKAVTFNYEIPLSDPSRERINFSTGYMREDTETSSSERYRISVAHLRELDSGWIATRSLDFEREFFTVADQRNDRTDLLMPGLELSRTHADDPIYPKRGWRISGKVRGAHEQAASTVSFAQFRGRAKVIFPLPGGRLLSRLEVGATRADEVVVLPSSVRFFAGGDNSVRGYGYQRLGPENDDGEVLGGRHMMVGSVEYDIPFLQQWSFAVFVDGGNAYDKLENFEAVYGVGAGIRWRSPIGPIRLDLAHPSDSRDDYRIHISMGPDL